MAGYWDGGDVATTELHKSFLAYDFDHHVRRSHRAMLIAHLDGDHVGSSDFGNGPDEYQPEGPAGTDTLKLPILVTPTLPEVTKNVGITNPPPRPAAGTPPARFAHRVRSPQGCRPRSHVSCSITEYGEVPCRDHLLRPGQAQLSPTAARSRVSGPKCEVRSLGSNERRDRR